MVPYLIEATLIPTPLFFVVFITFDLKWAIVAALSWTYAAIGRRIVTGRPIPACSCWPRWGSRCAPSSTSSAATTFVYFFQPMMRTVTSAAMFALSVRIGRPLIAGPRPTSARSRPTSRSDPRSRRHGRLCVRGGSGRQRRATTERRRAGLPPCTIRGSPKASTIVACGVAHRSGGSRGAPRYRGIGLGRSVDHWRESTGVRLMDVVFWLLLLAVIAIVVVVIGFVVRRRRRSGGVVAVGRRSRR